MERMFIKSHSGDLCLRNQKRQKPISEFSFFFFINFKIFASDFSISLTEKESLNAIERYIT